MLAASLEAWMDLIFLSQLFRVFYDYDVFNCCGLSAMGLWVLCCQSKRRNNLDIFLYDWLMDE